VIVVDTHALLWWALEPERLSRSAREVVDRDAIGVPVISCMEVAYLARRGRVTLDRPVSVWFEGLFDLPNVTLLPLTVEISIAAGLLRDPIRDPADRLIVATALHQGVALVTKDERIRAAGVVETIW
jgi:PIN domain nuclease of toxin-antitoxin system